MGVRVREKPKESGTWWVFIHHRGRRKSIRVGTERNARRVAERIEAELKLGRTLESEKPTAPKLGDYFERFQRTYLATAVRESTASSYESNFRVHILPELGSKRLDEVTPATMEDFVAHLVTDKKLAKATVALVLRELSRVF